MKVKVSNQNTSIDAATQNLILLQHQVTPQILENEPHQMSGRILRSRQRKSRKNKKKVLAKEQSYER